MMFLVRGHAVAEQQGLHFLAEAVSAAAPVEAQAEQLAVVELWGCCSEALSEEVLDTCSVAAMEVVMAEEAVLLRQVRLSNEA
jgi:hypothetical protein